MGPKVQSEYRRLLARRCVSCGCDDDMLSTPAGLTAEYCPRCGCDFHERPPRSYAEMEGLIGSPLPRIGDADPLAFPAPVQLMQRWLVFLFFLLVSFAGMCWLAAVALAI